MRSSTVTAFCPGHISGYFRRIVGDTVTTTGSVGAGIVISEGVTATVSPAGTTSIIVNRKEKSGKLVQYSRSSPPVEYVLKKLNVTASVMTECCLPVGAGFGLSAAAILATLTAVNLSHHLSLSPHDIAVLAHESEVIHRTGLGDVAACQAGGRVVRNGPGVDGTIIRSFDLPDPLCAVSFGPIATPSVLGSREQMERVAAAYPSRSPEDAEDFFKISRQFAEDSGLLTSDANAVLRCCDENRIPASMTMLGNGVFAYGRKSRKILSAFGDVYPLTIAASGARIIGVRP